MNGHYGVKSAIILVLVIVATLLCIFGAGFLEINSIQDMRLGIDIRGGVSAILYPEVGDEENVTVAQLEEAKKVIDIRLEGKGIVDKSVYVDTTYMRLQIEIPWKPGETDMNPQRTIEEIGSVALLTFQEVDESKLDSNGDPLPTGNIIVRGINVKNATEMPAANGERCYVKLELDETAKVAFAEATARLVNKRIAIFMDDIFISAPVVSTAITDGNAIIQMGGYTEDSWTECIELAETIRAGSLPFKLVSRSVNSISPTLGEGALKIMIIALLISFVIITITMIAIYKLAGAIASFGLYTLLTFLVLVMQIGKLSITLPGIAGIILTIGMGVDANIIFLERVKEEALAGKSLFGSMRAGFSRAFSAVFDGNITTVIVAVILYVLGSGPIKGFATTLLAGVIISFFTAITCSRVLLLFFAQKIRNPRVYGVNMKKKLSDNTAKGDA